MDFTISTALDLQNAMNSRIITIEEEDHFDGSFVVGCILQERVPTNERVVLVLHHHSFGHYQGIGTKLGLNLQALQDCERLMVIDVMREVGNAGMNSTKNEEWLEQLLETVYNETKLYVDKHAPVDRITVVLEHPGNIALAFGELPLVLNYIRLFQALSSNQTSLVYLTRSFAKNRALEVISASMQHGSHLSVAVRGLRTGSAPDISGSLEIRRKDLAREDSKRQSEFHYQLLDKKIRVFAPGTVQFQ